MKMDYKQVLSFIGNKISEASAFAIRKLSELGVNITDTQTKILNLIVILVLIWVFLKVITIPRKLVKFALIFLFILLGASIIFSMF